MVGKVPRNAVLDEAQGRLGPWNPRRFGLDDRKRRQGQKPGPAVPAVFGIEPLAEQCMRPAQAVPDRINWHAELSRDGPGRQVLEIPQ